MALRAAWFTGVASACAFVSLYKIWQVLSQPAEEVVPAIRVPKRRLRSTEMPSSNCSRRVSVDQLFGQNDDNHQDQDQTFDLAATCELLTNMARRLASVSDQSDHNDLAIHDLTTAISSLNVKLYRIHEASSGSPLSLQNGPSHEACFESIMLALRCTLKSLQKELSRDTAASTRHLSAATAQIREHQSSLDFVLEQVSSPPTPPPTPPPESEASAFFCDERHVDRPESPVSECSVLIHEEQHLSAPPPEYSPPCEPPQQSLSDTNPPAYTSKSFVQEEPGLDKVLYEAVTQNNTALVKLLFETQNVDPNLRIGDLQRSPLHQAAQLNRIVCIAILIRNGANMAIEDSNGDTPLHLACWSGHCESISVLLSHGAELEYLSGRHSYTPLFCAVMSDQLSALAFLLKFGASATNRSAPGQKTALHQAASTGQVDIIRLLLEQGRSGVDIKDEEDQTPLHYACAAGSAECAQLLLEHGAKVDSHQKSHGMTAIHWAAHTGSVEIIKLLASHGASLNSIADGGATPLHLAASKGKTEAVTYLLSQKSVQRKGVAAWNGAQGTPAQLARAKGYDRLAAMTDAWPKCK